jgi:hypothetical protein
MRYGKILVALVVLAPLLAACATPGGMTVSSGAIANPVAKYRNAIAVRSVSGGQVMNVLTVPGVANEPFKAPLKTRFRSTATLPSPVRQNSTSMPKSRISISQ